MDDPVHVDPWSGSSTLWDELRRGPLNFTVRQLCLISGNKYMFLNNVFLNGVSIEKNEKIQEGSVLLIG